MSDKKKWLVTHPGNGMKKNEIYEGDTLPAWLVGKAKLLEVQSLEVATDTKAQKAKEDSPPADPETDGNKAAEPKAGNELKAAKVK